ncbi:hypothetical protein GCK32_018480 [Trichostrongylus colubriformis]|uniref:Uncharacterized protein n=1 Tax=Trichostrongylus colubriformis TaxID=6319 RepID=A0AAN8EWA4_TRICO
MMIVFLFISILLKWFSATARRMTQMDAKSVMTADGYFVPSQSSIAEWGKQLKPAAASTAPTGTGTGLFGYNRWITFRIEHIGHETIFLCMYIFGRHSTVPLADHIR